MKLDTAKKLHSLIEELEDLKRIADQCKHITRVNGIKHTVISSNDEKNIFIPYHYKELSESLKEAILGVVKGKIFEIEEEIKNL